MDPVFANTDEWWLAIPEEVRRARISHFYHLSPKNADTEYVAYVSGAEFAFRIRPATPVRHPQVDEMFIRAEDGGYHVKGGPPELGGALRIPDFGTHAMKKGSVCSPAMICVIYQRCAACRAASRTTRAAGLGGLKALCALFSPLLQLVLELLLFQPEGPSDRRPGQ